MIKRIALIVTLTLLTLAGYAVDLHVLADSLDNWADFKLGCIPKVRVTQLKTKDNQIRVYTNKTLSGLSLSPKEVASLRSKVSKWVTGKDTAQVTIYTDGFELNELVTERFQPRDTGRNGLLQGIALQT